jgi:hypothetical protein
MGLRNPSEPTFQALTGILLGSHAGVTEALNKTPTTKHACYTSVKSVFKKTQRGLASTNFISPLPASVAEFQQKYPECYAQVFGSDPPANCPLDSVSLQISIDSVPMRKTHRDVSARSMAVVPTSDQSSQMMQMMQIMMQQQQQPPQQQPVQQPPTQQQQQTY